MGKLIVTVVEARDLVAADLLGKSDPYVELWIGNIVRKGKRRNNTLNPKFNETFLFDHLDNPYDQLKIFIWDHNYIMTDKPIGRACVPLQDLISSYETVDRWIKLDGVNSGEVRLILKAEDFPQLVHHEKNRGVQGDHRTQDLINFSHSRDSPTNYGRNPFTILNNASPYGHDNGNHSHGGHHSNNPFDQDVFNSNSNSNSSSNCANINGNSARTNMDFLCADVRSNAPMVQGVGQNNNVFMQHEDASKLYNAGNASSLLVTTSPENKSLSNGHLQNGSNSANNSPSSQEHNGTAGNKNLPKFGLLSIGSFFEQGINLAHRALQYDDNHQYEQAYECYIKALEFLITFMKHEKEPGKRQKIMKEIFDLLGRAEIIKQHLEKMNSGLLKTIQIPDMTFTM